MVLFVIYQVMRIEDDDWAIGRLNGIVGAFPISFATPL